MKNVFNFSIVSSFLGLWISTHLPESFELFLGFVLIFTFGMIHGSNDLLIVNKFLKNTFNKNFIEESEINFNNKSHPINKIIDKKINTFCPFKLKNNNIINITLKNEKIVDVFEISENINLGQRIKEFVFEIKVNEKWVTVEKGTTVGKKRLIKFEPLIVKDLRFTIVDSKDIPLISELGLYKSSK